jgi:multidrug efflux pump
MLSATFLGIFFVPVFFVLVRAWVGRKAAPAQGANVVEAN